MTAADFEKMMKVLRRLTAGTEWEEHVYAVGGCCRDLMLGAPIKDIDLVVDLPSGGIRFARWLEEKNFLAGKVVVYESFGTAMYRLKEAPDVELECVMTRKEKYPDRRSRNPETVHGTLEEDCLRRDLTINVLYYRVSDGAVLDLTGHSLEDLRKHVIRTPVDPDTTYDDDPLRILRCVRFAARLGWEIEPETFAGMVRNVRRLEIVTKERVRAELDMMLKGPRPVMAMKLLKETGAMHYVMPELEDLYDLEQNKYHSGTAWEHTLEVLSRVKSDKLEVRMAALLHDVGKSRTREVTEDGTVHFLNHEKVGAEMAEEMLRRLRYSNDFVAEVKFLVLHHMDFKHYGPHAEKMRDKSLREKMFLCGSEERFMDLMALVDADNNAHAEGYKMAEAVPAILERVEKMKAEGSATFSYKLPLSGVDVMKLKGLEPGPAVKECLDYLMKLAFANPLRDKEEFVKHLKGYKPARQ